MSFQIVRPTVHGPLSPPAAAAGFALTAGATWLAVRAARIAQGARRLGAPASGRDRAA